jgi:DNA-binding response OmpR family regulator
MTHTATILLIEADEQLAADLTARFKKERWKVVRGADAALVPSLASEHRPDVVVVDARLPGGGGVKVLQRLRSSAASACTPAVALTEPKLITPEALLNAGAQECLVKPVEPDKLAETVRRHIGRTLKVKEAPAATLHDPERLAALRETKLLDTAPEEHFDLLTRIASRLLRAPVALMSLVDGERQFFKSAVGLPEPHQSARGTPLSHSFCQWAVASGGTLIVEDAREHALLKQNAAVEERLIMAYAGCPILGPREQAIGSFCVLDTKARGWPQQDLSILRDLTAVVRAEIALRNAVVESTHVRVFAEGVAGGMRIIQARHRDLPSEDRDGLLRIMAVHSGRLAQLAGRQ